MTPARAAAAAAYRRAAVAAIRAMYLDAQSRRQNALRRLAPHLTD